jgi:hypothetical protein
MSPGVVRIAGLVVLAHGLGLRLDSSWQRTALALIVAGAAALAWSLSREASVSAPNGE